MLTTLAASRPVLLLLRSLPGVLLLLPFRVFAFFARLPGSFTSTEDDVAAPVSPPEPVPVAELDDFDWM